MDDLFGDLPAAKHSAPIEDANQTSTEIPAAASSATKETADITKNEVSKSTEPSKSKSLVSALGTAGTSMAFVPQALRKKKRSLAKKEVKGEKRRCSDADVQQVRDMQPQKKQDLPNVQSRFQQEEKDIQTTSSSTPSNNLPNQISIPSILHDTTTPEPPDTDDYLENEPPTLQLLHERAKSHPHPYNPHTPNDYLAHREKLKTATLRQQMQKSALAKMEAQEVLRQKVARERERLEKEGDLEKIVESRLANESGGMGRGRGRGRGMSNLPAWLVKKREEGVMGVDGNKSGDNNNSINNTRVDGCTISLLNMVPPGNIDPELSTEVREECGRFGTVTHVTVKDASAVNEYVCVNVTFHTKESAMEAIKMLDGRMFGERKIVAKMLDGRWHWCTETAYSVKNIIIMQCWIYLAYVIWYESEAETIILDDNVFSEVCQCQLYQ